jgi:hypothetical protein
MREDRTIIESPFIHVEIISRHRLLSLNDYASAATGFQRILRQLLRPYAHRKFREMRTDQPSVNSAYAVMEGSTLNPRIPPYTDSDSHLHLSG